MLTLCSLLFAQQPTQAQYALSIIRSNANVVLSWPTPYIGSQLQQTRSLASPWTDVPGSLTTNRMSLVASSAAQFFRLCSSCIPTLGLVARYDLNGDANDSVGGRHGIIHGAIPTSNRFTNGNSAYSFNGTNAYIELPDDDVFSIATMRKFSVSVWMRPGTVTFPFSEGGPGETNYVHWMGKGQGFGATGQQEWTFRMYNFYNSETGRTG